MTRFLIPARKEFHAAHSTINISLNSVQAEILNCGACSEAIVSNFLKIINNQIMQCGIFFLALKQMWKCSLGMWPPYMTAGKILGLCGESSRKSGLVVRDMPRPPQPSWVRLGSNPPRPTRLLNSRVIMLHSPWSGAHYLCGLPSPPLQDPGSRVSVLPLLVDPWVWSQQICLLLSRDQQEKWNTLRVARCHFETQFQRCFKGTPNDFMTQRQLTTGACALFFCVFQIASDSPAVSSTRWTTALNFRGCLQAILCWTYTKRQPSDLSPESNTEVT